MLQEETRHQIAIEQDVFVLLDKAGDTFKESGKVVRLAIEKAFCWLYPSNGDSSYNEQVERIRGEKLKEFMEGLTHEDN